MISIVMFDQKAQKIAGFASCGKVGNTPTISGSTFDDFAACKRTINLINQPDSDRLFISSSKGKGPIAAG